MKSRASHALSGGAIGRWVRRVVILCCAAAWLCIAVGWIVSYWKPFRVARQAPSRPDGAGNYVILRQDFFAAGGGVYLSFTSTTVTKVLGQPYFVASIGATNVTRSYPAVHPDTAKGTVFRAGGFVLWSTRDGPAYMFIGSRLPDLAELQRNPAAYGQLMWLTRDERGVVAPFWFLLLLASLCPAARLAATLRRRRRERRLRDSLCPACGYDMRASPERCPECGAANPGAV